MSFQDPFYLTTAIPYVNAPPHVGFALELLYTDVLARTQRLLHKDVVFVTGTDEYGQKIVLKAAESGKTPQEFTDELSELYRRFAKRLNISQTDFIRTTEARHTRAVQTFWNLVHENGYIYKKVYKGLYCVGCEAFKTEKELENGLCPTHRAPPRALEEENYFFELSAFRDRLRELYRDRPSFVVPETKFNEMKQLVEEGLEDVSISRVREHLSWGIPVPGDATQVVYVWFDAVINYLTAAGFASDEEKFRRYWPADIHVIGKDINRFHTVLWPAMLMAAGLEVPRQIAVHGFIYAEGQKMSKSLGNVIDPNDLIDAYGVDATRYLLLSQVPFTGDGNWSPERSQQKYHADLANDFGNLVYRVNAMVEQYGIGSVAASLDASPSVREFDSDDAALSYRFDVALELIWRRIREANQKIDREKPWVLAKEGKKDELERVLHDLQNIIREVAERLKPFMPETAEKILNGTKEPLFPRKNEDPHTF